MLRGREALNSLNIHQGHVLMLLELPGGLGMTLPET